MHNPQDVCPDDTICHKCGKELEEPYKIPESPDYHGFCSRECMPKMYVVSHGNEEYLHVEIVEAFNADQAIDQVHVGIAMSHPRHLIKAELVRPGIVLSLHP